MSKLFTTWMKKPKDSTPAKATTKVYWNSSILLNKRSDYFQMKKSRSSTLTKK